MQIRETSRIAYAHMLTQCHYGLYSDTEPHIEKKQHAIAPQKELACCNAETLRIAEKHTLKQPACSSDETLHIAEKHSLKGVRKQETVKSQHLMSTVAIVQPTLPIIARNSVFKASRAGPGVNGGKPPRASRLQPAVRGHHCHGHGVEPAFPAAAEAEEAAAVKETDGPSPRAG